MFEPLTIGFDWECWLVKASGLPVGTKELQQTCARIARREPDLPVGLDLGQLELRSGICRSPADVFAAARAAYTAARAEARRRHRRLLPGAAHPLVRNFAGGHVHVGTVFDYGAAERLQHALWPYTPVLAALAASSPFARGRRGGFKSYRLAVQAYGCVGPIAWQPNGLGQGRWGEDVCLKLRWRPALEVRVADAPVGWEVMAELAFAIGGLASVLADRLSAGARSPDERAVEERYLETLANRYNAARHGLQATFRWRGREVSAADLAAETLALSEEGLSGWGGGAADLAALHRMVALRATQADWLLDQAGEEDDDFALAVRLLERSQAEPFAAWLQGAPVLRVRPFEPLVAALRGRLGGYTPWTHLQQELALPPARLQAMLRDEARAGAIRLKKDARRGFVCVDATRSVERRKRPLVGQQKRRTPPCFGTWQPS